MKTYIKQFIKEIIPIIVGMLIALFINNWNETRKDKKYVTKIFSSIKKEFKETNASITDKIVLQKTYIDTLEYYINDDRISLLEITKKAGGIYMPTIRMNSWKAISNSRIDLIKYNNLSSLASIEEATEVLNRKTEKLTDFIYSNFNASNKNKKEFFKLLMLDIVGTEMSIQNEIETIIKNE